MYILYIIDTVYNMCIYILYYIYNIVLYMIQVFHIQTHDMEWARHQSILRCFALDIFIPWPNPQAPGSFLP